MSVIDPVCVFHGKRKSEHSCIVCCLCFRDLIPEECWQDEDGQRWDVCRECKALEALVMASPDKTPRCEFRTTKPLGALSQAARSGSATRYAQCKNVAKHTITVSNASLGHPDSTRQVQCCGLHKRMHDLYGWGP